MPPIQTLFMNSIVGETVPPNVAAYMMGTVADPQTFNDKMNFQADVIVLGSEVMNQRQAPPQASANAMVGGYGINGANVLAWTMAVVDAPQSSGAWTLHSDLYANQSGNYPPQIGAAY